MKWYDENMKAAIDAMNRPSHEEVIKLIEETKAATIAFHELYNKRVKTREEVLEEERLLRKVNELNKKRIEVLSMFSGEEREEIRKLAKLAQSKEG